MALTVKDILQLDGLSKMRLIAGESGLDRYVVSLGIADNEFSSFADQSERNVFEADMIILSTLLFAKEEPGLILSTTKFLCEIGAAAFACKTTIFEKLPQEVIDFANAHDFPIIQYDADLYMESIIFEILDAVRKEDDNFFSEENLDQMIAGNLTKTQIYSLSKNISLKLKEYVMAVYIKGEDEDFQLNLERYSKVFYLNRNLNTKALVCKYKNGLFALLTARQKKKQSFAIILRELMEFLSPSKEGLYVSCSRIHDPYKELDQCIRESYYTHIASKAEEKSFGSYDKIGAYQLLVPLADTEAMKDFMTSLIDPIREKPEFFETIRQLALNEGDIFRTASSLQCHHNTIRYRISKIKQFLFCEEMSDQEFYVNISLAVRLYMLNENK